MSRGARRLALWALALGYLGANYLALERAPEVWHLLVSVIPGDGTYGMIGLYTIVGGVPWATSCARATAHRAGTW